MQRRLVAPNPIEPSDSVWIEDLTYIEVRDRIANGSTTAIIAAGGMEENGPYLATAKHNVILESLCPAIVAELGNALCAPIISFVPEENTNPPPGTVRYPGFFRVREDTYRALLDDIVSNLNQHGFKNIVLIGDSGGNQTGMRAIAESLSARWGESDARVHYVGEYYEPGWEEAEKYTEEELGIAETKDDGFHDDIWVTAQMTVTDPDSVRHQQRVQADLASINGVDISSLEDTVALGKKIVAFRAQYTASSIRAAIARD